VDPSGRGEFAAIARIAERLPAPPPGQVWIGDDAAILDGWRGPLLFAADAVAAGVHSDLDVVGLDDLGWKAVAANVSDLAAMGGVPVAAVVTVAGPPDTDLDLLYEGIAAAADRWHCPIVGGDLTSAPTLVVTVAVLGDGSGDPPPVRRAGARANDTILVTGPCGASAAGLRALQQARTSAGALVAAHRRPMALLDQGRTAREAGATAMIDISDGLAADLGHLLDASGVGARLVEIPVAPGATIDDALGGGEDYQLLFTVVDVAATLAAFARAELPTPIEIGVCTADAGERTLLGAALPTSGWEHRWA
jgi:thiamine-monophosphate kinase